MPETSTQPNSAASLAQRLKDKTKADLEQVEQLTRSELEQLAKNLQGALRGALSSTGSATEKQLQELSQRLSQRLSQIDQQSQKLAETSAKAWLKPFLLGLSLLLGICAGSWGLMQYLSSSLESQLQTRARLSQQIETQRRTLAQIETQRRTLAQIEAKTWGVELHQNAKGERFLVLPQSVKPDAGWTVGDRPAVKLSSN